MRQTVHVLRTDIRQYRWLIVIWCLLVAADVALTALRPALREPRAYGNAGMVLGLLWLARQLATLLIVPIVVHAHPAVGTDAFWMTRPFAPLSLFSAKVVFLATLLIAVPAAADLALMLSIGVPSHEALLVVLETVILRAAWVGVLTAGAAVTLNLPRFALLCGAAFLALTLAVSVMIMTARADDAAEMTATLTVGGTGQPVLPPAEDPTVLMVMMLLLTLTGGAVAAIQYRTRLRRMSVPAAAGGLVMVLLGVPHWPFPLLRVPSAVPAWARDSGAAQLRADEPVIELRPANEWFPNGPALRSGFTPLRVAGLEPGWLPQITLLGASLTLENGTVLTSRRGYQSMPQIDGSPDDASRTVARQVLGVAQVLARVPHVIDRPVTAVLRAEGLDPLIPAKAAYRGQYAVHLSHLESAGVLPLQSGAVFDDGPYRFAIEQVIHGAGVQSLSLRAREWRATSSFDRKPQITYVFYVRDAAHAHAMAGMESEAFGDLGSFSFGLPFFVGASSSGPSRFFLRTALVSFPASFGPDEPSPWEPAWYANAELVIVRVTEAGAIARTLEMPQASIVAKR